MTSDVGIVHEVTEAEISAFNDFSRSYRIEHPEPKRPSIRLAGLLSWEFYATIVVAICAVLLAATRTAPTFYTIAVNDGFDGIFAVFSGAISLVAVEGVLFMGALIRTSKSKNDNTISLKVAEGIAIVISMIAGLHFVFGSFPSLAEYNNDLIMALAIIIGAGATILAWVAGSIVGNQISKARKIADGMGEQYKVDMETYRAHMLAAWKSSDERKFARNDLRLAAKQTAKQERLVERVINTQVNTPVNTVNKPNHRDAIIQWLDKYVEENPNGAIPGPTELARVIGCTKGHASIVTREWAVLRGRSH